MISHGDNDHAGGADSVLQTVTSGELLSSSADVVGRLRGRSCRRGQRWRWDGMDFTVLHPAPNSRLSGNDRSCVLRISAPGGSALLPGDIEVGAERRLLERNAESLSADILVAPHHGSRISSTPPFIRAVQPGFVVFPIGRGNRFDFPHRRDCRTVPAVECGLIRHRQQRRNRVQSSAAGNRRDGIPYCISPVLAPGQPLVGLTLDLRVHSHLQSVLTGDAPKKCRQRWSTGAANTDV